MYYVDTCSNSNRDYLNNVTDSNPRSTLYIGNKINMDL